MNTPNYLGFTVLMILVIVGIVWSFPPSKPRRPSDFRRER